MIGLSRVKVYLSQNVAWYVRGTQFKAKTGTSATTRLQSPQGTQLLDLVLHVPVNIKLL